MALRLLQPDGAIEEAVQCDETQNKKSWQCVMPAEEF
jgi:hypothetical protein